MLAIVGGTGLYELPGLEVLERDARDTPFGAPSGEVVRGLWREPGGVGSMGGCATRDVPLLFLPRHGKGHKLLAHEVNYRANIFALKRAGATQLLGFSAVGSLVEHLPPGTLAMPEQYIDWTRGGRARSFFGDGVAAHVSTAKPASASLVSAVVSAGEQSAVTVERGLTYVCVEGPRLGTQAESLLMRQWGAHLVGMTNVPEAFLAREAQMAYATVGLVTDYDCWHEDPNQHVTMQAILERYAQTLAQAKLVLASLLKAPLPEPEAEIRTVLNHAVLTADEAMTNAQRDWLAVLRA